MTGRSRPTLSGYRRAEDLPPTLPVFPLDGAMLLPGGQLPLNVFEPRYLNMVDDAMAGERLIGMIQTRKGGEREKPRLARVGCAGRITSFAETPDGRYIITLTGVCRFEAGDELSVVGPYRKVVADYGAFIADLAPDEDVLEFERAPFLALLRRYLDHHGMAIEWDTANVAPAVALVNSLAMALPFDVAEKQALLEAPGVEDRRACLAALMEIDALSDDDEPPPLQ